MDGKDGQGSLQRILDAVAQVPLASITNVCVYLSNIFNKSGMIKLSNVFVKQNLIIFSSS